MKMRINKRHYVLILFFIPLFLAIFFFVLSRPKTAPFRPQALAHPGSILKEEGIIKNIVLVTIDSLRQDYLGCYGYKKNISPNIDRLAQEGVLFEQAIAQGSWTIPSLLSIVTATYPSTHGVNFFDQTLPSSGFIMPQVLKNEGFSTSFISDHGCLAKFNLGFDYFHDGLPDASEVTKEALRFIEKNRPNKLFLWLHYMDTHDDPLGVPDKKHFIKNISKKEILKFTNRYEQAIASVDSQVGALYAKIKEAGLLKNTLFIITADHGQEMCEHGICFNHGGFLWDAVIRVPLIMFNNDLLPENKRISGQVQHIDILPTLCDILGIKSARIFEGSSVLPIIQGRVNPRPFVFSEHNEYTGVLSTDKPVFAKVCVRTPDKKLIYTRHVSRNSEEWELYDLKKDPQELVNIISQETCEEMNSMKAKLTEWSGRIRPKKIVLAEPPDARIREKLESLGYMQ